MRALATLWGLGALVPAPGTFGSLAALPLGWVLHGLGGFPLLVVGFLAVCVAGWLAIRGAPIWEADASEVIVDEVAGQLLALFPLSLGLWLRGTEPWLFPWPGWVGAFLAFRLFDIWKPWPINALERLPGAWGVMADDLLAGLFAALLVALADAVAHGWLT
ncbi:MAG: phosphatidylglycerophosphatase A [Pseudomonadota bacterium]